MVVMWMLYLILRLQRAEIIVLNSETVNYDSGTTSPVGWLFNRNYYTNPFYFWAKIFERRKVIELARSEVKFVHEKNPSRVYFDRLSERFDIGFGLSEPDIDFLYFVLIQWKK